MAQQDFIDQLKALGYQLQARNDGRIAFDYMIPVGKFMDTKISLGLEAPGDFPLTPPPGIHVSPHLLPLNTTSNHHPEGGINTSPFGEGWQYWSRPFPNWAGSDRTVRTYMAHVRHLFGTQ